MKTSLSELYHLHTGMGLPPSISIFMDAMPAPRMTRKQVRLVYAKNSALSEPLLKIKYNVQRYERYKQMLQYITNEAKFVLPERVHITFYMEMPPSWSVRKREEHNLKPHKQTPDTDNLVKAVKDALCKKDQHIWDERGTKLWAMKGAIVIKHLPND